MTGTSKEGRRTRKPTSDQTMGFRVKEDKPTAELVRAARAHGAVRKYLFSSGKSLATYRTQLKEAAVEDRINVERSGVPYYVVIALNKAIGTTATEFQQIFKIPPATYKNKIAEKKAFAGSAGQSVVGMMELINKVEEILDPSYPDATNFDVEKWVGDWIQKPQPSLGGKRPAQFMDTPSGREEVKKVLGAIASGAYL